MRQLVKITFINAADYDYFELKVDGDTAVYGINDGGKTTCARAVMYGEHGSINALNFGQAESIDYYFHKGDKDGLLVYDYEDVRSDGLAVPYCLIMTSREINFVTARFSKDWVLTSNGMMTTEWSKIREKIAIVEDDVKVYNVSSKRNLEYILQGSYADKNEDLRRLARHFSIFEGKNGKTCAAAKMIESLWKNGAMQQDDMKRIIIDRTESYNRERYEREPAFKIDAARTLADGFDEGWKDFEKYLSKELPTLMDKMSSSFSEYNGCRKRINSYPSLLASAVAIKTAAQAQLTEDLNNRDTKIEETDTELQNLKNTNRHNSAERQQRIGGLKTEIESVTTAYNKHSESDWEKIQVDIKDWERLQELTGEKSSLERIVNDLESSATSFTKGLEEQKSAREKAHNEFLISSSAEELQIKTAHQNDERLKELTRKKEHSKEEASDNLKEKSDVLAQKESFLEDERKRLDFVEHVVVKYSDNDSIADRFEKSNDLSFLGNLGKTVIGRFFKLVFAFICREILGIKSLTREDYLKEVKELEQKQKEFEDEKKLFAEELVQETAKIAKGYEDAIKGIDEQYAKIVSDLLEKRESEDADFSSKISGLKKQIEKVLKDNGIDTDLLESKRDELRAITERCNYLFENNESISRQKSIRSEYQSLEPRKNLLKSLIEEDAKESAEEARLESNKDKEIASLKEKRSDLNKHLSAINKELKEKDSNLEELSRQTNQDLESLNESIAQAEIVRIPEENLMSLPQYISDWKRLYEKSAELLSSMRTECQALQGMLSPKDFFQFSIKPNDSQSSDADILRIAGIVSRRNDAASEESINQFLNTWRQSWNQYLRTIYKIAERASELSSIEETVRHIQTFINKHNDAHSISGIRFEVEKGSENKLVKIALDVKSYLDNNGIDVNLVDVTNGIDSNLFMLENVSESIRRHLVDLMSEFAKCVKDYKPIAIPPEDFFTLYTCIKEENKPELRLTNINQIGSTGTGLTVKAVLTIGFVGEALRSDSSGSREQNAIHVFVDEFGRIDPWNKKTISKMCSKFNVRLFSAEPYASNEKGDVKYGYSLNYDKRTHHRSGKLIKELKLTPKTNE